MSSGGGRATQSRAVLVWDWPTRAFHWSLASLVAFSLVTGTQKGGWLDWHIRSGYAIMALLLFRLGWGVWGGHWARFRSFVAGPAAAIRHIRELFGHERMTDIGHNALGGWAVLALLAVLFVQVGTGLFTSDSDMGFTGGPLMDRVSDALRSRLGSIHAVNANLILALVALHVSAIAGYAVFKREDLIGPMLSGRKWLADSVARQLPGTDRASGRWTRALLTLTGAAAIVWLVVAAG
jgi:cytochrome b